MRRKATDRQEDEKGECFSKIKHGLFRWIHKNNLFPLIEKRKQEGTQQYP
jgi:hypothetical protein